MSMIDFWAAQPHKSAPPITASSELPPGFTVHLSIARGIQKRNFRLFEGHLFRGAFKTRKEAVEKAWRKNREEV